MSTFEAVILGIIQGLTEFLPISSSAHLRVAPALFGWDDPGTAFTAVIQLGTMLAVVLYFRTDLWRIGWAWLRSLTDRTLRGDHDARMGWYLIAGTIPIGVFGLLFEDQIQSGARDLRLIAGTLILLGLVLLLAEKVSTRRRDIDDVEVKDGLIIGMAQALALIPGVSRSGSTITAGLFLGFNREAAARFSFLLSVPAIVASGLFQLKDIGAGDGPGLAPTVIAAVVSFVVGYAAIAWLLRWLTNHSTLIFVAYRIGLGLLLIVLLATNFIEPR